MKKVGICTLHDAAPNFGATLQAFALQEVLKKLDYEPEFLKFKDENRHERDVINNIIENEDLTINSKRNCRYTPVDTKNISINSRLKKSRVFLNVSDNLYNKNNDIYNSIILGSDELWNVNNPSFEHRKEYYGYNLNCNNIFAYAPSCNTTTVEEFKGFHNNKIDFGKVSKLSARDVNTKNLIKEITGRDARLVLDPTMLLKSIENYAIIPDEKDYILIYDYNVSNERKKKIKKLAKEKNLPVYSIGFYCKWADKNIDANIFEFIGYMRNATYVVTATFHGTIFSILNKKQFVSYACLGYKIEDLLKRLELTDRDATGIENLSDIIDKPIDYDKVFKILEDERKVSIEYLKEALENEV